MQKIILISILSVIAILVITSCSEDATNPTRNNDEIFPLKVGNYWKFDVFSYDTLGNVIDQHEEIDKIVFDTIINNEKIFLIVDEINGKLDVSSTLIKRDDGIYIYFEGVGTFLLLQYPISKGNKFNSMGRVWALESTNYDYTTPMGNLSCYQYSLDYSFEKQNHYYKPGVGRVAVELFDFTQSGRYYIQQKFVLKEYKVN